MAKFNIPLSEIIQLAKTQACTYYLECHENINSEYATKESIIENKRESEVIEWEIDRRFYNCINVYVQTRE